MLYSILTFQNKSTLQLIRRLIHTTIIKLLRNFHKESVNKGVKSIKSIVLLTLHNKSISLYFLWGSIKLSEAECMYTSVVPPNTAGVTITVTGDATQTLTLTCLLCLCFPALYLNTVIRQP